MRDPKRIDPLLAKLGEAWKKYPDQRFGQFMSNFFGACRCDPWHVEEDEWMVALQAFIDGKKPDEAMEDYLDRKAYDTAMAEHQKNPVTYSMEDVKRLLEEDDHE